MVKLKVFVILTGVRGKSRIWNIQDRSFKQIKENP